MVPTSTGTATQTSTRTECPLSSFCAALLPNASTCCCNHAPAIPPVFFTACGNAVCQEKMAEYWCTAGCRRNGTTPLCHSEFEALATACADCITTSDFISAMIPHATAHLPTFLEGANKAFSVDYSNTGCDNFFRFHAEDDCQGAVNALSGQIALYGPGAEILGMPLNHHGHGHGHGFPTMAVYIAAHSVRIPCGPYGCGEVQVYFNETQLYSSRLEDNSWYYRGAPATYHVPLAPAYGAVAFGALKVMFRNGAMEIVGHAGGLDADTDGTWQVYDGTSCAAWGSPMYIYYGMNYTRIEGMYHVSSDGETAIRYRHPALTPESILGQALVMHNATGHPVACGVVVDQGPASRPTVWDHTKHFSIPTELQDIQGNVTVVLNLYNSKCNFTESFDVGVNIHPGPPGGPSPSPTPNPTPSPGVSPLTASPTSPASPASPKPSTQPSPNPLTSPSPSSGSRLLISWTLAMLSFVVTAGLLM